MPLRHVHRGARGAPGDAPAPPASPFQMYQPALKMLGVEPVGNYAIRIDWSDGHKTGIYSFEHFRRICPCEECKAVLGGRRQVGRPA